MSDYTKVRTVAEFVEARVKTFALIDGEAHRFAGCGSHFDVPRPLSLRSEYDDTPLETTFEAMQARVDAGTASLWIEQVECSHVDTDDHGCEGPVEYRFTGNGLRSRALCEHHQGVLLAAAERAREYMSVAPPDWFDPSFAGESWDDDY